MSKHIIAVTVENLPGVLTRVTTLIRRRGYNIDSLAVGAAEDPSVSRMTVVVEGADIIIGQVTKQLYKLIDVIKVVDLTKEHLVERELVLIKVKADHNVRPDIVQIVDIFRARIVDIGRTSLIVEATGDKRKIDALEDAFRPFGILELVRTGKVAMVRGTGEDNRRK